MNPHLLVFTRALVVLLLLGLMLGPRPAQAETTFCTAITTAPTTITTPGIYCLTQDIATNLASGAAITIAANNVVLDLNAHRLANLAAGTETRADGISALQRTNLTIKNGTIRGFQIGILLDDSSPFTTSKGHVIEDLRVDQNTDTGIWVRGLGNIIRNNQVVATGGSTAPGATGSAVGILVSGPENRVLNNNVIDTVATGSGFSRGIGFDDATDGLAVNNRITQAGTGILYNPASTGKFRDNLTSGVDTPFDHPAGVVNVSGNN